MTALVPPIDELLAPLHASVPLDGHERAALDELDARFGIRRQNSPGEAAIAWSASEPDLESLNATLWTDGEHDGAYLAHRGLASLAARAAVSRLGAEHPVTLSALHNHANCLEAAGRLRESRDLFEFVLRGRRATAGRDSPSTLLTQNDLGLVLHALGDTTRARRLHEDALKRRLRVLGDDHPQTLSSMNNLAVALRTLGEIEEATRLVRKVLSVRLELRGADNRDTLMAFNNLAACLVEAGKVDEARSLLARAWRGFSQTLGDSHRDTLTALHNLAWCHQSLGEMRAARGLYEQLIERCRQALGDKHPDTLTSECNLARFLAEQGDGAQAAELLDRVLQAQHDVLGSDHEDTLRTREQRVGLMRDLQPAAFADEAVLLLAAVAEAPTYTGSWPGYAASAGRHVAAIADPPAGLSRIMARLSRGLLEAYDLAPSDKRQRIARDFMAFHRSWLALCLAGDTSAVPEALSAIHGREISALLMGNWTSQSDAFDATDPRRRFLDTRRRIIDIRVQMEWLAGSPEAEGLRADHDALIADYRHQRAVLADSHPGFYATGSPVITEQALRERLDADECAVLLVPLGDGGPAEVTYWALCVQRTGTRALPLPGLAQCLRLYRASARNSQGPSGGLRLIVGAAPEGDGHADGADGEAMTLERWTSAVYDAFWSPVIEAMPAAVRTVHLVTHERLHPLPLEHGGPRELRTRVYPGLVFLAHRLSGRRDAGRPAAATGSGRSAMRLAVHTDTGTGALGIPLARADAATLAALARRHGVSVPTVSEGGATLRLWQPGGQPFDAWHFACHGRDLASPRRQTVLALDEHTSLDASMVQASGQRPTLVVLGACVVGRVQDSPTGEPLGLISGLWLAGAEYIVAPVQPVPDFWMPVLTALFYDAWLDGADPATALDAAKRRLQSGRWPAGVEAVVHEAYVDAIAAWLPTAACDRQLAAVVQGWYLPGDLARSLDEVGAPDWVAAMAATDDAIHEAAHRIAGHLVDNRSALPRDAVEHLVLWVRGFGLPREREA